MMIQHTTKLALASLATLSLLSACGGGEDNAGTTEDTTTHTHDMALSFMAHVGNDMFSCDTSYTLGTGQSSVEFTDFKFYISEINLIDADGNLVPAQIVDEEPWQVSNVAMIDFEDGTGSCSNGTAATRTAVHIKAPHGDYKGVEATIGIPFELNHEDVTALPSPLNLPSMFWSWQGGRKFLRLDGKVDGAAGLRIHLGSTGCMGELGDISSCTKPNKAQFRLEGNDPTQHVIKVDIAPLFTDLDLTPNEDKSVVCMSSPDTESCGPIFDAMGVSHELGTYKPDAQLMMTLTDTTSNVDIDSLSNSGADTSTGDADSEHAHH